MATIAYYCPMKPPTHPVPSGDRLIARLLEHALQTAGFNVERVSTTRTWRQQPQGLDALHTALAQEARRYLDQVRRGAQPKPALWFTYHNYYKAPDLLGPRIARALHIPYCVAEPSWSPARLQTPWRRNALAVRAGLRRAQRLFHLNPADQPACAALCGDAVNIALPPFLDADPLPAQPQRQRREALAQRFGLATRQPWLITAAMMRPDAKRTSYQILGQALQRLRLTQWQWLAIGDGAAAPELRRTLAASLGERVTFTGQLSSAQIAAALAAADGYVWPGCQEAFSMALLEAQAVGLPVIAGHTPGIAGIVRHGHTGILVPDQHRPDFPDRFAAAIETLLQNASLRRRLGRTARETFLSRHSLTAASATLRTQLTPLLASSP